MASVAWERMPSSASVESVPRFWSSSSSTETVAATMKTLGSNPQDLSALIRAGELSAQLDDGAAALQFFARAEKISPNDPRIARGRGSALVRMGRPGEALRQFAKAEAAGDPPVLVCAQPLRLPVRRLIEQIAPRIPVLSYAELGGQLTLVTSGVVNVSQISAA